MIALVDEQLLKFGLDIFDDPLRMERRDYLIFLAIKKDDGDVEADVLAEVYIERVVLAPDSFLEDPCEGRLHVTQSHLYDKVGD